LGSGRYFGRSERGRDTNTDAYSHGDSNSNCDTNSNCNRIANSDAAADPNTQIRAYGTSASHTSAAAVDFAKLGHSCDR
jgi:hypothetical protein